MAGRTKRTRRPRKSQQPKKSGSKNGKSPAHEPLTPEAIFAGKRREGESFSAFVRRRQLENSGGISGKKGKATGTVQRTPEGGETSSQSAPQTWPELAQSAKEALTAKDLATAETLYKQAIVASLESFSPPPGVEWRAPSVSDININWDLKDDAVTQIGKVGEAPNNYWHWIQFGPTSLRDTEAFTKSVAYHELVHVKDFQGYWQEYQAADASTRGTWEEYAAANHNDPARVQGPEELAAHLTGIDFYNQYSPQEKALFWNSTLEAYILNESFELSNSPVLKEGSAQSALLKLWGDLRSDANSTENFPSISAQLWKSLYIASREGNITNHQDVWISTLTELKAIAELDFNNPQTQPFYLSWAEQFNVDLAQVF